jgi:pimeloyl-ACP methyl ester carboxylesterase
LALQSSRNLPPEEHWTTIGELRVRYLDWGGDGAPVMLMHGLASSAHWYEMVASRLRDKYRLFAADARGHGQTTQASSGYDWETLAADAVGLMDQLSVERAAVFGHSWGATAALNVAARFPERVYALGLIDGGAGRSGGPREPWETVKARVRPRDVSGTREQFLDRLRHQLSFCWNDQIERIVQTMVYEDQEGQIQDILRPDNHLQVMQAMWEEPTSRLYGNITCPTAIIPAGPTPERANSERALQKQAGVEAASRAIPHCRVCWIPETVHDIGYHKPDELARVMDEFLSSAAQR